MSFAARLLRLRGSGDARSEMEALGLPADMAGSLAAETVQEIVRLSGVPAPLARLLRQCGEESGVEVLPPPSDRSASDLLLLGSFRRLHRLAQELAIRPDAASLAAELSGLLEAARKPPSFLAGRGCRLSLERPLIMGVLNATPDSFFAGSRSPARDAALRRGLALVEEGADLIDVGGESTRPGASAVSEEEELERIVPLIEALRRETGIPLSVDTYKARVAREAVSAGADFINDVSGLRFDPEMAEAAAQSGAGLFLMHTRGRPDRMQEDTSYRDLVGEILGYLEEGIEEAEAAGVPSEKIAVDPGIGFGKSVEGNLEILRRLREFEALGRPILIGTSRKGFIGKVLGQPDPSGRLTGTLATMALGVAHGAHILRVHDVGPAREAALMAWAILRGEIPTQP